MGMSQSVQTLPWRPSLGFEVRLREVRRQFGTRSERSYTQEQFAQMLKVSVASYKQWEAGNSKPKNVTEFARSVQDATGVPAAWLLDVMPAPDPGAIDLTGDGGNAQLRCTARVVELRTAA